jgi:hypothetical protein
MFRISVCACAFFLLASCVLPTDAQTGHCGQPDQSGYLVHRAESISTRFSSDKEFVTHTILTSTKDLRG